MERTGNMVSITSYKSHNAAKEINNIFNRSNKLYIRMLDQNVDSDQVV